MTRGLLLDTHVFLWWLSAPERITGDTCEQIATTDLVFVSGASAWETAIKVAIGKLRIEGDFAVGVEASQFQQLPIRFEHAARIAHLPLHHRDPFDRMLVAQAQAEDLTLVTSDAHLRRYDVAILDA